ncbi:MAG: glycosyltransferase family 2 protein [Candidatus Omnitrophica bacterium]|nr:glycosyltransferase family 2 protein [Candidatus Omnitrophota bacterium]
MKIAAVYCVYNEEEYIEYSIRSIVESVDRVVVLLGQAPYAAYNTQAREQFHVSDRTEAIIERLIKDYPKITLVKGTWDSELEHRNVGVQFCRRAGMQYYFLVDGDEVYRRDHLEHLQEEIRSRPRVGQFIIKCDTFWRSFRYRIPASQLSWMPRRVFKLTPWSRLGKSTIPLPRPARFTGNNKTDSWGSVYHIPPERVIFYHFSYARRPEKMYEKLRTFSHAHEIPTAWYEQVWTAWAHDRGMTNLNPVDPPKFPQAIYQDPSDLPEILRQHPYYAQEVIV